jgi:hypothetical protein
MNNAQLIRSAIFENREDRREQLVGGVAKRCSVVLASVALLIVNTFKHWIQGYQCCSLSSLERCGSKILIGPKSSSHFYIVYYNNMLFSDCNF